MRPYRAVRPDRSKPTAPHTPTGQRPPAAPPSMPPSLQPLLTRLRLPFRLPGRRDPSTRGAYVPGLPRVFHTSARRVNVEAGDSGCDDVTRATLRAVTDTRERSGDECCPGDAGGSAANSSG